MSFTILGLLSETGSLSYLSIIKNPIALTAFALAVAESIMLAWLKSRKRQIPTAFWIILLAFFVIGIMASFYPSPKDGVYRIRITVLDPDDHINESAKIKVVPGGEPKLTPVTGGAEFVVPVSEIGDGKLTITATQDDRFLAGRTELQLGSDFYPKVTVKLEYKNEAKVRGEVFNPRGDAVSGARVWISGYGNEAVTTSADGHFELSAHAATGEMILLHVECAGYKSKKDYYPAGRSSIPISLQK